MKLTVTCCVVLAACFFSQTVSPQEPAKKTAGNGVAQEEKKGDEKGGTKDNRFPDGHDYDFGKVARGTYAKHTFRIVNTSDLPIEIIGVRTAAGAVKGRVNKAELQPKEVRKLLVVVETSRFVGPKTVTLFLTMRKGKGSVEEFRFLIKCNSDEKLKLHRRFCCKTA